ncbi:MAG: HNH endonuclease [Slackia sp.]|nr:HNH endonuclease [Slackia sp.]
MPFSFRTLFETLWLCCKGFRPVEFVREDDRISLHPSGWRVNGSGRMKHARDAVRYLENADPEQWRQIYCGMTPFLVSDKGNVKHIDGQPVKMSLANGRYQIMYKPEDARGRGRDGRTHKKRVYRSMLVAMAWLDFRKGDTEHEVHHINGYRTDDRVSNLMVVDHKEHLRIHNLGPCGLSGLPDEKIVQAPADGGAHDSPAAEAAETDARHDEDAQRMQQPKRTQNRNAADRTDETDARRTKKANEAAPAQTGRPNAARTDAQHDAAHENENAEAADAPETRQSTGAEETQPAKRKRRRGKRGGKKRRAASEAARDGEQTDAAPHTHTQRAEAADAPQTGGTPAHDDAARTQPESTERETQVDWERARARLDDAVEAFLVTARARDERPETNEAVLNKAAKPVYKAFKPFLTCPDSITSFDAALSALRTIEGAYHASGAQAPGPVHSMTGTMQRTLKNAVRLIAEHGDPVETACLRELLAEEAAKELFRGTPHERKFKQCLSVLDSRNDTASERA